MYNSILNFLQMLLDIPLMFVNAFNQFLTDNASIDLKTFTFDFRLLSDAPIFTMSIHQLLVILATGFVALFSVRLTYVFFRTMYRLVRGMIS